MLLAKGVFDEFQSIYVLPSAQGYGIGRALMAEMARHLSQLAISGGACRVLRENDRARRFYEALGGQIVSEQTLGPRAGGLVEVAYGWLLLLGG
jgi:ribosomal protein S18 acetylase RimI-like enzyme